MEWNIVRNTLNGTVFWIWGEFYRYFLCKHANNRTKIGRFPTEKGKIPISAQISLKSLCKTYKKG